MFYFLQVYIHLLKLYFFIIWDQHPDSRGSLYQICKSKTIIIALTVKFVKSYHTALSYLIVQSHKYIWNT